MRLPTSRWRVPLRILGRAVTNFIEDGGARMAAAVSFYALFSLFPITLLAVSIFGIVLRNPAIQETVLAAIIAFLPVQDESIANSLRNVADLGPTLTIVAALGSVWSAGALSAALRSALSVAFDVEVSRPLLRAKLIDYMLLPIIGLPLIGGVVLTAAWRVLQAEVAQALGVIQAPIPTSFFWNAGAWAIPFVLSFVAFSLMYWLLPNKRVLFRHIWPGALLAALGFEALKAGFAAYVENLASFNLIYGSLGSAIVLLFWVYLVAYLVIYCAEVAAEVPHVLNEEPRHGHADTDGEESDWRSATLAILRGLVFVGDTDEDADPPGGGRRRRGSGS